MAELRDAALAYGSRQPPEPLHTDIAEIRRVGDALGEASKLRSASESEREALLERERAARTEAEQASRAKDELLATLGHELRNPLAAVSSAALALERTSDPDALERLRAAIVRQVAHLTRLTDDILEGSRALRGRIELRRESTSPRSSSRSSRRSGGPGGPRGGA
jgi:signal transduction histidine kinase